MTELSFSMEDIRKGFSYLNTFKPLLTTARIGPIGSRGRHAIASGSCVESKLAEKSGFDFNREKRGGRERVVFSISWCNWDTHYVGCTGIKALSI